MNNHASESAAQSAPLSTITIINTGLARRYRRERRFRLFGLAAIVGSLMFLVLLLGSIGLKGWTAFVQTRIHLDIHLDPARLDVQNLATANYAALVRDATLALLPAVESRQDRRLAGGLVSGFPGGAGLFGGWSFGFLGVFGLLGRVP